ncbi:MAG: MGMT family protein [Acidobacteria bacterium]|nr:MGMT family protein [Acidobacteriota bacterium]
MFSRMQAVIRRIPIGKVSTYGAVASAAGYPGAARQVVWALRAPGSRGLPWHRVVGAGGRILLPSEDGFEQRLRLRAEQVGFLGDRVNMAAHEWAFQKGRAKR